MFCDYFSPWPMYGEETSQAPLQNELHALQENMHYVCAYNFSFFVETKLLHMQFQAFNQEVPSTFRILAYGRATNSIDKYCQLLSMMSQWNA